MTIYIAGAISNRLDTYKAVFDTAEVKLKSQGHIVWNPANNPIGLDYEQYFPVCFAMIDQSDAIYLLDGWQYSKGAVREYRYACDNGKMIMYENPTPLQALQEKFIGRRSIFE